MHCIISNDKEDSLKLSLSLEPTVTMSRLIANHTSLSLSDKPVPLSISLLSAPCSHTHNSCEDLKAQRWLITSMGTK